MKAIVFTEYGPPEVLRIAEVAKPIPKDREVLIKVRATPLSAPTSWNQAEHQNAPVSSVHFLAGYRLRF